MRTVFLGTSAFAASVLRGLVEAGRAPTLVVSRPDRPRGRGRRLLAPPAVQAARAAGIACLQPEDVNGEPARAAIAAQHPDVVCVCAYGALLAEPLLSDHEMLNVHPSLLPRWRGAAPVERAIMAGDEVTGVSIMRVAAGLDSGPVALAQTEPIAPRDTYGTLAPRLERIGVALLVRALGAPRRLTAQDEARATYAAKIEAADRLLDGASESALELDRRVRALSPHIGARVRAGDGTVLGVLGAHPLDGAGQPPPGEMAADGERLLLGASPGTLEIDEVTPPGGRPMTAAAFLRGHPMGRA